MGKGQNEGFSEEQVEMYKECFKLMDVDKDGTISKNDLRAAFDNVGKLMTESELDDMLGEVGGSCNFDNMIKMFQTKMAGGSNDPDDLIVAAFKAYEEENRKVSAEKFRWALTKWGDKFSAAEVDDIFNEFEIDDDGFLDGKAMCSLFVAGGGEEKKPEEPAAAAEPEAEAAAAPEEGGDDGGKKKKKKKKAAK
jgi:Ca2+-binding EF-hand superfamily protein